MPYHIKADAISIEDVKRRIESSDLIPSRISLLNGLNNKFGDLKKQGFSNLTDLLKATKTPKKVESLAQSTGIENNYLVLLRREINSYFPKPFPLKSFDWLPQTELNKLEEAGLKNTALFFDRVEKSKNKKDLNDSLQIKHNVFQQLICLCDLVRMQWTSPLAARMYIEAGYDSVHKIVSADPDTLFNDLAKLNEGGKYFKGKIGLRDIKRLINSTVYIIG